MNKFDEKYASITYKIAHKILLENYKFLAGDKFYKYVSEKLTIILKRKGKFGKKYSDLFSQKLVDCNMIASIIVENFVAENLFGG